MYTSRTCLRILGSASVLFGIILCTEGLVLPLPRDLEGVEIGKSKNVFFVQNDVNNFMFHLFLTHSIRNRVFSNQAVCSID